MRYLLSLLFFFHVVAACGQQLPTRIPYRSGNKWGYSDSNKKVLITPQWNEAKFFYGNHAMVTLNKNWCLIDTNGHYIIFPDVHWRGPLIYHTYDNATLNCHNDKGKWGFIDTVGKLIVPMAFDDFVRYNFEFHDRLIILKQNNKCGIMNDSGKICVPFIYDSICRETLILKNTVNRFIARKNGRFGVIDGHGVTIVPFVYNAILCSKPKLNNSDVWDSITYVVARSDSGFVIINLNNKIFASSLCDDVSISYQGIYFRKNGKWGMIDPVTNVSIPAIFDQYFGWTRFEDSSYEVSCDGKASLYDKNNKMLLSPTVGYDGIDRDSVNVYVYKFRHVGGQAVSYYRVMNGKTLKRKSVWRKGEMNYLKKWLFPRQQYEGGWCGSSDNCFYRDDTQKRFHITECHDTALHTKYVLTDSCNNRMLPYLNITSCSRSESSFDGQPYGYISYDGNPYPYMRRGKCYDNSLFDLKVSKVTYASDKTYRGFYISDRGIVYADGIDSN